MARTRHTINGEATEAVFAKYGGVKQWLEACDWSSQPEMESEHIATISMATLMQLNENKLILDSEQEQVFAAVEEGINFGLYVLAYNFMAESSKARIKIPEDYYKDALALWARDAEAYINSVSASGYTPAPLKEQGLTQEEQEDALAGYMKLINTYIDEVCPDMTLQDDFIKGAKAAECVFICALRLMELIEMKSVDDNFFKLIEDI